MGNMVVTSRMHAAANQEIGDDVNVEWLSAALEHHRDSSTAALERALVSEIADFRRKGGRDVDQAEFIDGLRAVLAIRRLKDPKDWSPREGKGSKKKRPH